MVKYVLFLLPLHTFPPAPESWQPTYLCQSFNSFPATPHPLLSSETKTYMQNKGWWEMACAKQKFSASCAHSCQTFTTESWTLISSFSIQEWWSVEFLYWLGITRYSDQLIKWSYPNRVIWLLSKSSQGKIAHSEWWNYNCLSTYIFWP